MSNYTTQMDAARKGIVTPEIEKVAKKEKMDVDKLMELVASGRLSWIFQAMVTHSHSDRSSQANVLQ